MASPCTTSGQSLAHGHGDFAQQPRDSLASDPDLEASYPYPTARVYPHSKFKILRHRIKQRIRRFCDSNIRVVEKIDLKMRNPDSIKAIHYETSIPQSIPLYIYRWTWLVVWMALISYFHADFGLDCAPPTTGHELAPKVPGLYLPSAGSDGLEVMPEAIGLDYPVQPADDRMRTPIVLYAELFLTMGIVWIMANGQLSIRGAREKMVRVQHHATTVAYCLFKTTEESNKGYNREDLQHLIYECLFLITAYPVCLLHQMDGNTCEPDVTRYCHEVAGEFQRMRQSSVNGSHGHELSTVEQPNDTEAFRFVDHYFEAFALKLDREFRTQKARKQTPSSLPQKIISNIRSHHQNLVDRKNLQDRNVAILRENIDAFSAFGRECQTHSYTDIVPIVFLWCMNIACWIALITYPIRYCDMLINSGEPDEMVHQIPTLLTILQWFAVAIPGPVIMMLRDEMWGIWHPYKLGINVHSWILGIAREMDLLVNDFYEYEPVRKHSYAKNWPTKNESESMEWSMGAESVLMDWVPELGRRTSRASL